MHAAPLLTLADPDQRRIVEHWAAQADSLPEFLEMLHLEGLIDLDSLRQLLAEHSPLYRIWEKLRAFCQLAPDIGEYPAHRVIVSHGQDPIPKTAIRLSPLWVHPAAEAWTRFEAGEHGALHSPELGIVLSVLAFGAGKRLELRWSQPVVFADWVSALITNCTMGHGNDAEVLRVEEIASYIVHSPTQQGGGACVSPQVWEWYRPRVAAVVRALRARK